VRSPICCPSVHPSPPPPHQRSASDGCYSSQNLQVPRLEARQRGAAAAVIANTQVVISRIMPTMGLAAAALSTVVPPAAAALHATTAPAVVTKAAAAYATPAAAAAAAAEAAAATVAIVTEVTAAAAAATAAAVATAAAAAVTDKLQQTSTCIPNTQALACTPRTAPPSLEFLLSALRASSSGSAPAFRSTPSQQEATPQCGRRCCTSTSGVATPSSPLSGA
jgi:hypothetical protein